MPKPKSQCINCNERHAGCHGTCEKYKNFRKELDAWNEKVNEFREKEGLINGCQIESINRHNRKKGK